MILENLRMAGRSIIGNKLRTFLTMLGIIIGVAAVVAINSIGQGVKQLVTNEVSGLGANVLIIMPGKAAGSGGGGGGFTAGLGASTLTQQDVTTAQHNSDVSTVAPMSIISAIVANGTTQDPASSVIATTPSYLEANPSQKIGSGRFLAAADTLANVAVLSSDSRDTLFGKDATAVGKAITIRGQAFTVIGVLQAPDASQSGFGGAASSMVYIPTGTAQALTNATLQINRIVAQAKSTSAVQPAVDSLTSQIKKNHGGQEDFSVLTQKDILATFNTILSALTGAISAIAAISLLVGGIGIMNIMLVSVTERTREIGVRMAVGATPLNILLQFLVEALTLAVAGGMLGVALGVFAAGRLAAKFGWPTLVRPDIVVISVCFSGLVGVVFGLYPARKASQLDPIDALRYE